MPRLIQKIPRNAALLGFLLLLIAAIPMVPGRASHILIEVTFDLILLAGIFSVALRTRRPAFMALTFLTLGMRWADLLGGHRGLDLAASAFSVVWLAYAITLIVGHLFQRRDVTTDTILGAIVAYLLAAVAFALVFEIIELRNPGSFSGLPVGTNAAEGELANASMYFSLVCITTMGFGDIVPVSNIARPLAVIEGVFGQLYLAVMIARLVGLHIASSRRDDG